MTYPFTETVKNVVNLLVAEKYRALEALTSAKRFTAEDIARTVTQYGRVLSSPPEQAYEELDVIKIQNASVPKWSVRMGLWTLEDGRSDLSIELTLIQNDRGYAVELDDIHVL